MGKLVIIVKVVEANLSLQRQTCHIVKLAQAISSYSKSYMGKLENKSCLIALEINV